MRVYELTPNDCRKSFYKKAFVRVCDGAETLLSYGTPVIRRNSDGTLTRLWDGYSATTQRHINAFCGLNKAQFTAMDCE